MCGPLVGSGQGVRGRDPFHVGERRPGWILVATEEQEIRDRGVVQSIRDGRMRPDAVQGVADDQGPLEPFRQALAYVQSGKDPYFLAALNPDTRRAVELLAAAFEPGPAAGLITASRSIVNAYLETGGDPPQAAAAAAEELREAAWELSH